MDSKTRKLNSILILNIVVFLILVISVCSIYFAPHYIDSIVKLSYRAYQKSIYYPFSNKKELKDEIDYLQKVISISKNTLGYEKKRELLISIISKLIQQKHSEEASKILNYAISLDQQDVTFKLLDLINLHNKDQNKFAEELNLLLHQYNYHPEVLKELSIVNKILNDKSISKLVCSKLTANLALEPDKFLQIIFRSNENKIIAKEKIYNVATTNSIKRNIPTGTNKVEIIGPNYQAFSVSDIKVLKKDQVNDSTIKIETSNDLVSKEDRFVSAYLQKPVLEISGISSAANELHFEIRPLQSSEMFNYINYINCEKD